MWPSFLSSETLKVKIDLRRIFVTYGQVKTRTLKAHNAPLIKFGLRDRSHIMESADGEGFLK